MPLAPPLLELEQTVNRLLADENVPQDALQRAFGQARSFLLESDGLFREVEDTLVTEGDVTQKLSLCRQEMEHSFDSLQKLEDAAVGRKLLILKDRLSSFLVSRTRCLEYFGEFSRLAAQQPVYSPVPLYDAFIKTGVKVMESQLPSERLAERFPGLVPELHKVERLVTIFPKLHEVPTDLQTALQQGLQGLQTGYGALQTYFDKGDKVALEDGLKLLGSSSTLLGSQLQLAEALAAAEQKYSSFRPVEEWLRLKNYINANPADQIPEPWISAQISQIFYLWDFALTQAQQLLSQPILAQADIPDGLTPEILQASFDGRAAADKLVAELNGPKLLSSPDQVWLDMTATAAALHKAVEVSHKALEAELTPFKELPGLENIAGMIQQVKNGQLDPAILSTEFGRQLEKVEELIASVENANDPISKEFRDLLPLHRSAFLGMQENLESQDWFGLESRWAGVLTTLPHLANLSKTIRLRLAAQSSSSKLIKCLKCGHKNDPDRRVCSNCGANLPTVIQQRQTFDEINTNPGGSAPPTNLSPRAIDMLESMVSGLENNQTTKKDAAEALDLMIKDVNRQRQVFSKKLLPLMGKDANLDSYLRYFAQGLGQYFANLMSIQEAVQQGNMARIHSTLSETRDTLLTLDAMKERVDGALRG